MQLDCSPGHHVLHRLDPPPGKSFKRQFWSKNAEFEAQLLPRSFESVLTPPLQRDLGTLVWSAVVAHLRAIAAFTPVQTIRTKGVNEL